jgi:hypothetical protein
LHFPSPSIFARRVIDVHGELSVSTPSLFDRALEQSCLLCFDRQPQIARNISRFCVNAPIRRATQFLRDRSVHRIYQLSGPSERSFIRKLYSNDCPRPSTSNFPDVANASRILGAACGLLSKVARFAADFGKPLLCDYRKEVCNGIN